MNAYLESELQSYTERHIERDFARWLPFLKPFRMLGSQVQCANGFIDILGVSGYRPVIVELKAELATEKVVGQVLRYRAAVQDTFERQVCDLVIPDHQNDNIILGDIEPACVVIAPAYHDKAVAGLGHFAWLLEAQLLDRGNFSIVAHKSARKHYAYDQPKLDDLLQSVSAEYLGWRIGATIATNHKRLSHDLLPYEK